MIKSFFGPRNWIGEVKKHEVCTFDSHLFNDRTMVGMKDLKDVGVDYMLKVHFMTFRNINYHRCDTKNVLFTQHVHVK